MAAHLYKNNVCIYDLPEMIAVQKVVFGETFSDQQDKIKSFDNLKNLESYLSGKRYVVHSYWAFTEFPFDLREKMEHIIFNSDYAQFACNSTFEGVDNVEYFKATIKKFPTKKLSIRPITWQRTLKNHSYVAIY